MIKLIWAMDENWLVGKGNLLPWRIEEDLKYFQKKTKNKTVLMGNETYKSMKGYYKNKKFPFQKIYVANLKNEKYEDAIIINDVKKFLNNNKEEIFVIGGPTIYKLALPYANKLYITFILDRFSGDVYFPEFNLNKFKLINYKTRDKLIFTEYERKK